VKVDPKSALINKGGTSLFAVKLMPPLIFFRPDASACFASIAVTFGTAASPSIDAGVVEF
jgi:hypothetical protein